MEQRRDVRSRAPDNAPGRAWPVGERKHLPALSDVYTGVDAILLQMRAELREVAPDNEERGRLEHRFGDLEDLQP
jgi:hypothetical protein